MSQGFAGILEQLIGPPGGMILLILAGLWLLKRNQHLGKGLIIAGLGLFYVLSIPFTAGVLLRIIEAPVSITSNELEKPRAQAIVVLGGGRRKYAPEYHLHHKGQTIKWYTLERIRYASWLSKATQLPILASGGLADDEGPAESIMMKEILEQEFSVKTKWIEEESRNTYENAQLSSTILKNNGISKIYLVTHAIHMKRAKWAFEQQGIEVFPAPTAFMTGSKLEITLRDFLPSASSLKKMSLIFHESIGNIWYRILY